MNPSTSSATLIESSKNAIFANRPAHNSSAKKFEYYKITNKKSGKVLDIQNGAFENGSNVHQWEYVGGTNQHWNIIRTPMNLFKIEAYHSRKVLDIEGESEENGANVHQWEYCDLKSEMWEIINIDAEYCIIKNHKSGKVLDVDNGRTDNGANVKQWEWAGVDQQLWKIEKIVERYSSRYPSLFFKGTFNNWTNSTRLHLIADEIWYTEFPVDVRGLSSHYPEFNLDIYGDGSLILGEKGTIGLNDYLNRDFYVKEGGPNIHLGYIAATVDAPMHFIKVTFYEQRNELYIEISFDGKFSQIPSIVKKNAPILHFHPDEGNQCCYPSDAEKAYNLIITNNFKEDRSPDKLQFPPCYYQYRINGQLKRIKYWFWYNYNDYPDDPGLFGSHKGDWESIEVILKNDIPTFYIYSCHKSNIRKKPQEASLCSDGCHVLVWVANGSHANYPYPDYDPALCPPFEDEIEDGGAVWNTGSRLVDIYKTNFGRDNYMGSWGDPDSPLAPHRLFENGRDEDFL